MLAILSDSDELTLGARGELYQTLGGSRARVLRRRSCGKERYAHRHGGSDVGPAFEKRHDRLVGASAERCCRATDLGSECRWIAGCRGLPGSQAGITRLPPTRPSTNPRIAAGIDPMLCVAVSVGTARHRERIGRDSRRHRVRPRNRLREQSRPSQREIRVFVREGQPENRRVEVVCDDEVRSDGRGIDPQSSRGAFENRAVFRDEIGVGCREVRRLAGGQPAAPAGRGHDDGFCDVPVRQEGRRCDARPAQATAEPSTGALCRLNQEITGASFAA